MDLAHEDEDDAAALTRRRAALRAFADEVAGTMQSLAMPESFLEAERGARAITVADRIIVRLTNDAGEDAWPDKAVFRPCVSRPCVSLARKALRRYADILMAAAAALPKPDSFLMCERAVRYALAAERMLTQLYEAPKPKTRAGRFEDDDDDYAVDNTFGAPPGVDKDRWLRDQLKARCDMLDRTGGWGDVLYSWYAPATIIMSDLWCGGGDATDAGEQDVLDHDDNGARRDMNRPP